MNRSQAIFAGLLLTSTVLTACAGGAKSGSNEATSTPEPNINIPFEPTATPIVPHPTATTVAGPTTAPVDDPVVVAAPRVLWVRSSHAGPGAVTIRFETNVPTTAEVWVMTNQVGPAHFFEEVLAAQATHHATSVPANAFGRYVVRVEDRQGNVAWATLRYQKDTEGIDWATGNLAPSLSPLSASKLAVEWSFPQGHPSKMGFDGSVRVFSTAATCTTADSCIGDPVGQPLEAAATPEGELESHAAQMAIPGSKFNYQMIIGQPLNVASSTMIFLQLDIRGDQLPKTNVPAGPGTIKN